MNISCLIVSQDDEDTIETSINLLRCQTLKLNEIVVVDGSNNDRLLRQYKHRRLPCNLFFLRTVHMQELLAYGLMRTTGDYVLIVGARCWALPFMVEKLAEHVYKQNVAIIVPNGYLWNGKVTEDFKSNEDIDILLTQRWFLHRYKLQQENTLKQFAQTIRIEHQQVNVPEKLFVKVDIQDNNL